MSLNFSPEQFLKSLLYNPNDPLLLNSGFFLSFFALFLIIYQFVHKNRFLRVFSFTVFSLYFFYKACGMYVILVILAAIIDFTISNRIFQQKEKSVKTVLLIFSIIINLGLLFYFKYTDFFINMLNDLQLAKLQPLNLLLPIGISFYTFENISYTVDVYRGKFEPVKSFWDYLFFLSFFPKLVMGPIVRASDFIPQIAKNYSITRDDVAKGFYLIVSGLFKKVVISDYIYTNYVQYIFDDPSLHTGIECLLAVYGYAMVIYCDFSGYSDIAIGIAKWMGFDINVNFLSPYQSKSITEFWRRWHISLSSWLRDYVYIPLGGNRKGKFRQYLNLLLTMLIGGFWHGANWTFIIWGGMHGVALAIDKLRIETSKKFKITTSAWLSNIAKPLGVLITFHIVCLCWIFFKCSSVSQAMNFLHQIVYHMNIDLLISVITAYKTVFILMGIGYLLHFIPDNFQTTLIRKLSPAPVIVYAVFLTSFIIILIQVKTSQPVMPIYLRF
jgi:alginate O-acetyltransferase complex protein AlgI